MDPGRWQKVQDIFHVVSDLDGSARADYLDRACDQDLELRAEVEACLRSLDAPTDILAKAVKAEARRMVHLDPWMTG